MDKFRSIQKNQRYIVETITMTTVTERRIIREAVDTQHQQQPTGAASVIQKPPNIANVPMSTSPLPLTSMTSTMMASGYEETTDTHHTNERSTYLNANNNNGHPSLIGTAAQITGILKGGKLWKTDQQQVSEFFFLLLILMYCMRHLLFIYVREN